MDIQEIKTWAKNKIESDDLAKQVKKNKRNCLGKTESERRMTRDA